MNERIVVFNRIESKFYKRTSEKEPLHLIKEMKYDLGRERNHAMQDDKPGRDQMRIAGSVISHSMTREKDPHEDAAIQFMRMIAEELKTGRNEGSYEKLVLIADPHMMGLLKNVLDKSTANLISNCILKNFIKISELDVESYIQATLKKESFDA